MRVKIAKLAEFKNFKQDDIIIDRKFWDVENK